MRIVLGLFLVVVFTISCTNSSPLIKAFGCEKIHFNNLENETDFFENFNVSIPKNWKKSYYYDDLQSEIFAADTAKIYNETYMMEFSWINANMQADENFKNKVIQKATTNHLTKIKDQFIDFKQKKGYYLYAKGVNREGEIHVFQFYVKINDKHYFMVKTEIFGNENVQERLCESLNIVNSIKFKK